MTFLAGSAAWIRSCVQQTLDFAFPPQCACCGALDFLTEHGSTGTYCSACIPEICPDPINRCLCCGAEIGAYARSEKGCTHCRNRRLGFDSVVCLGMYDGKLRQAVLSAKWSFSAVRMRSLARLLATYRKQELKALNVECIVPVPQHWRQRATRHFNPSWVIAEELAAVLEIPCDPYLLHRDRRTRPQKRVAVSQRFENQAGTFLLRDAHVIPGHRFLLTDDVLTTGATCSEAARILKNAGAESCHVAVLGRVLDHSA